MKFILLLLISIAIVAPNSSEESTVYICNSNGAKKYHYKKHCRGLSNCKAPIKRISLTDARKRGRTLCGWED